MEFEGYSLDKIKELFFSDASHFITLKKDDVLMEQGGTNDRLYLVLEGKMKAFSDDFFGNSYEVFRIRKNMFAGVYSFFSGTHTSRTTIVATEDTRLAYLESHTFEAREDTEQMVRFLMPVVLSDLIARMRTAHQMAKEKEEAITSLLKAEKMSTLGQLAAGLAHELNNAVGVVKSKSQWLGDRVDSFLSDAGDKGLYPFFLKGREEGQTLSSKEIRERKKQIADVFGISDQMAKELARTGSTVEQLKGFKHNLEGVDIYWDIGAAFHDIELASNHASVVVQSVKELGAGSTERRAGLDLNKTLKDALTLIQSVLRQVEVTTKFQEPLLITGSSGELVQVWINLLKNACESMINAKTENALLSISTSKKDDFAIVKVLDNGAGIPEALIEKIFQPNVTTKKGGLSFGLGLGLPISQRIIEGHNGTIEVTSRAGQTEFCVKLPL